jgi:hypothetical protein
MVFVPDALVFHTHPSSFFAYFKKKYKFAYWRMLAVRKNPGKGVKDSHTPQIMKLQVLFAPVLTVSMLLDLFLRPVVSLSALVSGLFLLSTVPFAARAARRDAVLGVLSPFLLAVRSLAQFMGVAAGCFRVWRTPAAQLQKKTSA